MKEIIDPKIRMTWNVLTGGDYVSLGRHAVMNLSLGSKVFLLKELTASKQDGRRYLSRSTVILLV